MNVLAVGLNHRTAPLDIRERVALTRDRLREALDTLVQYPGQGVILSTCNRTEVYTLARDVISGEQCLRSFLTGLHGNPRQDLSPYLYTLRHAEAIRHLFRVAAGLDSMILGESQILGQVRDAYSAAVAAGATTGPLSKLFHQALRVGKRARRETAISRNALSVSYAAVGLARHALGDLVGRGVVVVGAGEAGKLVARALENSGVDRVWVTNRTHARAQELAQELGGQALPFPHLEEALTHVDIVVTSTDSPGYLLHREMVERALQHRRNSPLLLIDIAVPRDVDPAVGDLEGVHLYDIDDLEQVSEANRQERLREAERVEEIVRAETQRFLGWWDSLSVTPTVAALRRRAEVVRRQEVERTLRRLPGLTPEERGRVEAMSQALTKKLLHHPIVTLRAEKRADHIQTVRHLFRLDDQDSLRP